MTTSLEDAIKAVLARLKSGQPANTVPTSLLAEEKGQGTRLLCLDLRFWVELGRVRYGLAKQGESVLRKIERRIEANEIVIPIDDANAIESVGADDPLKRSTLCEFMVDLSRNHALLTTERIRPMELSNAVNKEFLGRDTIPIRPKVLGRGLGFLLGATPPEEALARLPVEQLAAFESPEFTLQGLEGVFRSAREDDQLIAAEGHRIVSGVREIDQTLTIQRRRQLESENIWDGSGGKQLQAYLVDQGMSCAEFKRWLDEGNAERFWSAVPGTDTTMTLMLTRDRNKQEGSAQNDLIDWQFLQKAIPYADAVATERRWAAYARASGLAARYSTVMISSLKDLNEWLDTW